MDPAGSVHEIPTRGDSHFYRNRNFAANQRTKLQCNQKSSYHNQRTALRPTATWQARLSHSTDCGWLHTHLWCHRRLRLEMFDLKMELNSSFNNAATASRGVSPPSIMDDSSLHNLGAHDAQPHLGRPERRNHLHKEIDDSCAGRASSARTIVWR